MSDQKDSEIEMRVYDIEVGRTPKIQRLDAYLSARFPDYSRTFITKLIKDDKVKVDGESVKPAYTPATGDKIVAQVPALVEETVEPEDIELEIAYEDEWILVINKPSDMVVHPSRGHQSGTLVNAAAFYCKNLSDYGGALRPGIVHRLDRDTTGAIIMVKDDSVHEAIAQQFEARTVEKEYLAVCEGTVELDADLIDAPIGKHNRAKEKMAVRHDLGKPAQTVYKVAERIGNYSVVRCFPRSGRTHQIRVHMKHIGHPLVGDAQYGSGKAIFKSDFTGEEHKPLEQPLIERQALHARKIKIFHPAKEQFMEFETPVPNDIQSFIDVLRELYGKKEKEE